MNSQSTLDVIDRDGWRRSYPLEKSIIYIGSLPKNDIVLSGDRGQNVAPLHAQIIAANGNAGYQLVNLSDTNIPMGTAGDQILAPRSAMSLNDGQTFILGEFTLIFHGQAPTPAASRGTASGGGHIGLDLTLAQTQLAPNQSLSGIVTVHNLGQKSGVQFDLDIEGFDAGCYDIEPGPLLSSGADKEVFFQLHHRGAKPLAGDWQIVIRATAPRSYPGEQATVEKIIQVLPFYRHKLNLISPDRPSPSPTEAEYPTPKAKPDVPAIVEERPGPVARTSPPAAEETDLWSAPPADVPPQPVDRPQPPQPRVKPKPQTPPPRVARAVTTPPPDVAKPAPPPPQPAAEPAPSTSSPAMTPTESETQDEDWWSAPPDSGPPVTPAQPAPAPQTEAEAGTEDWWSAPPENVSAAQEEVGPLPPAAGVEAAVIGTESIVEAKEEASPETSAVPQMEITPETAPAAQVEAASADQEETVETSPDLVEQPVEMVEEAVVAAPPTEESPAQAEPVTPVEAEALPEPEEVVALEPAPDESLPTLPEPVVEEIEPQIPPEISTRIEETPSGQPELPPALPETEAQPARSESGFQPRVKKWWSRVVQTFTFSRGGAETPSPTTAETPGEHYAVNESASQEAVASSPELVSEEIETVAPTEEPSLPAPESMAQPEKERPAAVEETEPIPSVEEERLPPEVEPPAEIPAASLSQAEEELPPAEPQTEPVSGFGTEAEPPVEAHRSLAAVDTAVPSEAVPSADTELDIEPSPPSEAMPSAEEPVETEPPAIAGAEPADTEAWWTAEPESSEPVPDAEQPEPTSASKPESPPEPESEDWWSTEFDQIETRRVLKLKASAPPESTEAQPPASEANLPAEAEDWWTAEPEETTDKEEEKQGANQ